MADQTNRSGGIDFSGQAHITGDVAGRDIFKQEAAAPLALNLHQIPAPPPDFTGREAEIDAILSSLDRGATISGVRGMGGIGKTALAYVIADRVKAKYPDAQFFIDLRGASDTPLSPKDALAHVIRGYYPTSKLPDDEAELQGLYRSVLHGKHALILLDDAKDAEQIKPLLPPASCCLLITTRYHFHIHGLSARSLETLAPDDARDLLLKIAPRLKGLASRVIVSDAKQSQRPSTEIATSHPSTPPSLRSVSAQDASRNDGETPAAEAIAKLCGYLPLALCAAGGLLEATPDLDPADYIEQLRDERTRLEHIGAEGVDIGVEASLNLSYARLSADAAHVFCRLAVFPAPFDADAEETICKDTHHAHLSQLVRMSLVQYEEITKHYSLHDLVRIFADEHIDEADRLSAEFAYSSYFPPPLFYLAHGGTGQSLLRHSKLLKGSNTDPGDDSLQNGVEDLRAD